MDRIRKAEAYRKEQGRTGASALAGTDPELAAIRDRLEYGEIAGQGCLDARQRRLITLVVLAAIQTPEGIGEETRAALHQGVRPEEIREALYQCAPYIGFPRTEAALRHADAALEAAGMALPLPEGGTVSEEDRFEKGLAVQTGIFGDAISKMHASAPEGQREILVRHLSAFCFGDIYTRTGLDLPLRELLTFCIISALGAARPRSGPMYRAMPPWATASSCWWTPCCRCCPASASPARSMPLPASTACCPRPRAPW